jgi:hypothetical protein
VLEAGPLSVVSDESVSSSGRSLLGSSGRSLQQNPDKPALNKWGGVTMERECRWRADQGGPGARDWRSQQHEQLHGQAVLWSACKRSCVSVHH